VYPTGPTSQIFRYADDLIQSATCEQPQELRRGVAPSAERPRATQQLRPACEGQKTARRFSFY